MQRSALCRSQRELSNEYLLPKFSFDTAENEPCKASAVQSELHCWLVAQCGAAAWIGRFVSSRKGSAKDRNTSVGGGHVMATPGTLGFSASGTLIAWSGKLDVLL